MEPRLRGPQRDPQRAGNFRQRQVEVVVKDDEGACLRLEAAETALELVTVGHERQRVVEDRHVDGDELDIEAMAPEPARLIDAGADQQTVEPRVEAIGLAQRGQVAPGPDERLMDGVLGLVWVTKDEPCGGVEPEDGGAGQHGEGVMIAPSRPFHEFQLHHALGGGAADVAALTEYGEATSRVRSVCLGDAPAGHLKAMIGSRPSPRPTRSHVA